MRGLQVARGLFLQQVQQLAAGAAALGDDTALLRAQARDAGRRRASAWASCRWRCRTRCSRRPTPPGASSRAARAAACEDAPSAARRRARAGRSLARHPARARLRTHGQRRARARSPGGARGAAARRSGDADARRGGRDGADRRDRRRQAEGGARRRARGGRLRRPAIPTRRRSWPRRARGSSGPLLPARLQRRRAGHRDDGRSARGREPSLLGRARAAAGRHRPRRSVCSASPSIASRWPPRAGARARRWSLGALSALLLAMVLSNLLARRMTRPLQNLHAGALAIARGDLDTSFAVDTDDEIGDVAEAFRIMTRSLRENQEGLAARVRELVTVHQVGRAVSSVVDLGQVLRAVITEILNVLGGKTVAIALAVEGRIGEAPAFVVRAVAGDPVGRAAGARWRARSRRSGRPRRTPAVEADPQLMEHAERAGPARAGHRGAAHDQGADGRRDRRRAAGRGAVRRGRPAPAGDVRRSDRDGDRERPPLHRGARVLRGAGGARARAHRGAGEGQQRRSSARCASWARRRGSSFTRRRWRAWACWWPASRTR